MDIIKIQHIKLVINAIPFAKLVLGHHKMNVLHVRMINVLIKIAVVKKLRLKFFF
jgi:hypothetical protein